jgi:hypothetical protein
MFQLAVASSNIGNVMVSSVQVKIFHTFFLNSLSLLLSSFLFEFFFSLKMSGLGKFYNTVPLPQKIGAWVVAGAVFGAWTWFEQRDNGKVLSPSEVHHRNKKIAGTRLKSIEPKPSSNQ